jgi:hypothetical protein
MDGKVKVWVLAALLAALAMVPFVLQRGTLNKVRAENGQLQAQVQELRRQSARSGTNAASTNQPTSGSLSNEQLLELMRLRAEVTALRKLTNAAAGAPLRVASRPPGYADPTGLVSPATESAPMTITTNSAPFNYRGFARPEDTMSTMVWAMGEGRLDLLLSSATPEAQAQIQQEYAGSAEKVKAQASEIVEIKPSPNHPPTENEVYMSMVVQKPEQQIVAAEPINIGGRTIEKGQPYTLGAQVSETLVKLQRVGNEWKFAGKTGK